MTHTIHVGDCLEWLRSLPDNSVDSVVTDPPYGLGKEPDAREVLRAWLDGEEYKPGGSGFMGRAWDAFVPSPPVWAECLRVLKPGGHLLAFAGTRTYDWIVMGVRLAGFEVRDMVGWIYGSGFPKSLDLSKAIDKQRDDRAEIHQVTEWIRAARDEAGVTNRQIDDAFGFHGMAGHWTSSGSQAAIPTLEQIPRLLAVLGLTLDDAPDTVRDLIWTLNGRKGQPGAAWFDREVVGTARSSLGGTVAAGDRDPDYIAKHRNHHFNITAPATEAARQWAGWGTALKPSCEPIVWARKPLNAVPWHGILRECSVAMEALIWSMSPAKCVEACSASSLAALVEEFGSVPWSAALLNMASSLDGSGLTDTFNSPGEARTLLSIASSWNAILAASWRLMNTSTTKTETDLTTAWKTCESLASLITPESTMQAAMIASGVKWSAENAVDSSSVSGWSLPLTPTHIAVELATSPIAAKVSSEIARIAERLSALSEGRQPSSADGGATQPTVKPDVSPVVMARKPLSGTVAQNVLEWGTGGINVDGCRVGTDGGTRKGTFPNQSSVSAYGNGLNGACDIVDIGKGRWPANIIHDGSPEVLAVFPVTTSGKMQPTHTTAGRSVFGQDAAGGFTTMETYGDTGSAARFYYAAKASRAEREHGLDALPRGIVDPTRAEDSAGRDNPRAGAGRSGGGRANIHPTVKPVDLMRYLLRLVTPPGGLTIDPYAGSGTTGVAAVHEGFRFAGCELETPHALIAVTRIAQAVTDEREERELATMQQVLF